MKRKSTAAKQDTDETDTDRGAGNAPGACMEPAEDYRRKLAELFAGENRIDLLEYMYHFSLTTIKGWH